MVMDSEDIMVAGIEENMRGSEYFNENFLSVGRELQVYICPKNANHKNEYLMNV